MANSHTFDVVVIGGGPAGTCGASTAAVFGRNVALVERQQDVGGAGINTGTVPSKTLRETALALSGWRSRKLFGVDLSLRRQATVAELTHHMDDVICGEHRRIDLNLARSNVKRFHGVARFVDPHSIQVTRPDGSHVVLHSQTILIATGSSPVQPPEFPFADDRVHDSDELLGIKVLPKTLIVVGAGVIGSEYACTFAALGVKVTVVDFRDALLPFLDHEMSAALLTAMTRDGITFLWNETVVKCELSGSSGPVKLHLSGGQSISSDAVLVCAGRKSNTEELDLASAGITPGRRGLIEVDAHYRTTVPHIYAAGDVIGAPALAATSMEQGRIAMCDACNYAGKSGLAAMLPTGVYTIPEISAAGETEEALKTAGIEYIVGRARYSDGARGRIIGDEDGFLKLLFRKDDMRLLGVHVIGEHATEVVHIGMVAMLAGQGADLFNRACFNYPTLGDLYKYATYDALLRRDNNPNIIDRTPAETAV